MNLPGFFALLAVSALASTSWAQDFPDAAPGQPTKLLGAAGARSSGGGSALVGGSDNCATPDAISGYGSFAFDNTAATIGGEGQSTTNCTFYGQATLDQDVWFRWTAPATARIQLSTCGTTSVDTKIAVYSGTICPSAMAVALACNDDINGTTLTTDFQSMLFFDVTAGAQYLIQVGTYPAAGGGTGTMSLQPFTPSATCTYDDGSTENGISVGAAGTHRTTGWLTRLGVVGQSATVSAVSSAWGWTGTGSPLPAGLIVNVGVFEDPNDDGIPTDGILLATASATMVGQHTDVLQTLNLPAPVTASGIYFIAAWVAHTNGFPAPADTTSCAVLPGLTWCVGNSGATLNTTNLGLNTNPPFRPGPNSGADGQIGYVWLMRGSCTTGSPGTAYCFGDGTGTACPCGNSSAVGNNEGCLHSFGMGGKLVVTGNPSLSADTIVLRGTRMTDSSALYFQGTTQVGGGAGSVFGDGKRCAGGTVIRLGTTTNVAGSSQYPFGGNPPVSVRGLVTLPGTRTYQIWYRNAAAFCTSSTFNLANGWEIAWGT